MPKQKDGGGARSRGEKPGTRRTKLKPLRVPGAAAGTTVYSLDPLVIKDHHAIDYIHSYAEDSPFFIGLSQGKLLGSECSKCRTRFATPRAYCLQCGSATKWFELPLKGRVHTWTTCYFGSETFLKETPFNLCLVEFDGVDTLFLARLVGIQQNNICIGMKVRARFRRRAQFKPTDVYFVAE